MWIWHFLFSPFSWVPLLLYLQWLHFTKTLLAFLERLPFCFQFSVPHTEPCSAYSHKNVKFIPKHYFIQVIFLCVFWAKFVVLIFNMLESGRCLFGHSESNKNQKSFWFFLYLYFFPSLWWLPWFIKWSYICCFLIYFINNLMLIFGKETMLQWIRNLKSSWSKSCMYHKGEIIWNFQYYIWMYYIIPIRVKYGITGKKLAHKRGSLCFIIFLFKNLSF